MTNQHSNHGKPPLMHITDVSPVMKYAVQSHIPDTFLHDLLTKSERMTNNQEVLLQEIAIPRFGIRFYLEAYPRFGIMEHWEVLCYTNDLKHALFLASAMTHTMRPTHLELWSLTGDPTNPLPHTITIPHMVASQES